MEIQQKMIHDYDADEVYFSPWLKSEFPEFYAELILILNKYKIPNKIIPCTNDFWCRDYMPIQTDLSRFVCYRYYPDYLLEKEEDKKYITNAEKVSRKMGLDVVCSDIIIDGGNVVKVGNKIIMTEKVFVENPGITTKTLENLFGCEIIFLPWDKDERYGHADGIVKTISDDRLLMTNYDDFDAGLYDEFKRRLSRYFKVETLHYNVAKKDKRNWAYINFLSVGKLIILPELDIEEDAQALAQIKAFYPGYNVEQINITSLLKEGGGLNCVSWCRKTK